MQFLSEIWAQSANERIVAFYFRVLCLKALGVIAFTVFALYLEVVKGCHRMYILSDSEIGVRFNHAEGNLYCSGTERLDHFHQLLCMNGWLNYNKTYDIPW